MIGWGNRYDTPQTETIMTNPPAMTPTRRAVLQAARDGNLWRSERGFDLYASYAEKWVGAARRKVTAQSDWLAERRLIHIGDRERGTMRRPWVITDAGRAALGTDEDQR